MTSRHPPWLGSRGAGGESATEISDDLIQRILELWDVGYDTADIAEATRRPEAVIARGLRIGKEKRRQAGTNEPDRIP